MTSSPTPLPDGLLEAEELPTIPAVAMEVLRLCRDEDTTLDDLAEVLAHDAALSARLLRFANSSLYNLGSEVSTLQRATLVLGMKTVQLMSLTFSLAPSLPHDGHADFDYELFWRRSLVRAVSGRALATLVGTMTEDEVFLCGLLGEVGQVVMIQCLTDEYVDVLGAVEENGWPSAALERSMLGYDNIAVGVALLEHWGLPERLIQTVYGMRGPVETEGPTDVLGRTCNVLHLACLLTEFLTGPGDRAALAKVEAEAERLFELPPSVIDRLIENLEPGLRETSDMLSMEFPEGRTPAEVLAEARGEYEEVERGDRAPIARRGGFDAALLERIASDPKMRDTTTACANAAALKLALKNEIKQRLGGSRSLPLGLLCIQADDATTDDRTISEALVGIMRKSDLLVRASEHEFVVLVHTASPFGLKTLAERLRRGTVQACGKTVTLAGLCIEKVANRSDGGALHAAALHLLRKARSRGRDHCLVHGTPLRITREAS